MDIFLENFKRVNQLTEDVTPIGFAQEWEEHPGSLEVPDAPAYFKVNREAVRIVAGIPMKMPLGYQIENAATAILAARVLLAKWMREGKLDKRSVSRSTEDGVAVIQEYIRKGVSETFWKGRMELVNENPFFMIDGAHNSHGVWALRESLKELYPDEKFHFIMGVMADKDYEEMIDALLPLAIDFVTVTPESNRALQAKDLAECIQRKGVEACYAENMEEAIRPLLPQKIKDVINWASKSGTPVGCMDDGNKTIAFGSLYFIGAIEAMLEENDK